MKEKGMSPDPLNTREQEILQRLAAGLSDQQIADELFLSLHTVKWYNRQIYGKLGVRSRMQAAAYAEASPSTGSLWNVPYRRNPCFTGREDLLRLLRERFASGEAVALTQPQALSGLGGIGKTQVAVEYAYRYRPCYQAVFWVRAASLDTLIADFASIATRLCLPGQDAADQATAASAARRWLSQQREWLLILDNADDLAQVAQFFPEEAPGHLLLTTRAQATGTLAVSCCVEQLDQEDSCLLLLRRANRLAKNGRLDQVPSALLEQAQMIVKELGGLPLALEQAGAYLEETSCSLSEYLALAQCRRSKLLAWRSPLSIEYPHSVASTWELSFRQIEEASPAAVNLLRLCAFLDPDAIPELLLSEGASALGPGLSPLVRDPLRLHAAIQLLRRYSFIRRDHEARTLTIHRLVQAILRESLDEIDQRGWAERTIRAVATAFPKVEFPTWPVCQQYLPHALACAALIEEYQLAFPEAGDLLHRAGSYALERSLYSQALALLQQALAIRQQVLGSEHPHVAAVLNDLGVLSRFQAKYQQAESFYQRALTIREQALGPLDPETAATLYNMAHLCNDQGKYQQAESLYQRVLAIWEQTLGAMHPNMANVLADLGTLYSFQSKYQQAESLYQRALAIQEQILRPNHPDLALTLYEVAYLCRLQGKYQQAEPLYQRALAIWEQARGSDPRPVAHIYYDLGQLYVLQGQYQQAEASYQRALAILEQIIGAEHPDTALILNSLADLYITLHRYDEAEPLCQRARKIYEQTPGLNPVYTANALQTQARLSAEQALPEQAEALYQRALIIREQTLGTQHPETAKSLTYLGQLYQAQKRYEQAEALFQRALAIREQVLGLEHPETITVRALFQNLREQMRE